MTPALLMLNAAVYVEPGTLMVVKTPRCQRKPRNWGPKEQFPTTSPEALIPQASEVVLPGTLISWKVYWRSAAWVAPPIIARMARARRIGRVVMADLFFISFPF